MKRGMRDLFGLVIIIGIVSLLSLKTSSGASDCIIGSWLLEGSSSKSTWYLTADGDGWNSSKFGLESFEFRFNPIESELLVSSGNQFKEGSIPKRYGIRFIGPNEFHLVPHGYWNDSDRIVRARRVE